MDIDLSGKVNSRTDLAIFRRLTSTQVAVPVVIVNQLANATMFTFDPDGRLPLEVLTPYLGFSFQYPMVRASTDQEDFHLIYLILFSGTDSKSAMMRGSSKIVEHTSG